MPGPQSVLTSRPLQQGFKRVCSILRKRSRLFEAVVDPVHLVPKVIRFVQPPVGPIEPRVKEKHVRQYAARKPPDGVLVRVKVAVGPHERVDKSHPAQGEEDVGCHSDPS